MPGPTNVDGRRLFITFSMIAIFFAALFRMAPTIERWKLRSKLKPSEPVRIVIDQKTKQFRFVDSNIPTSWLKSFNERDIETPAEAIQFPHVGVQLRKPLSFTADVSMPGFRQEQIDSSILVRQLPIPYDEIDSAAFLDRYRSNGLKNAQASDIDINGHSGKLLSGDCVVGVTTDGKRNGDLWAKLYIFLCRDHKNSIAVFASCPLDYAEFLEPVIKRCLMSCEPIHSGNTDETPADKPEEIEKPPLNPEQTSTSSLRH